MSSGPLLVLTASMGSGHTQTARELTRRLPARVPTCIVDLLDILPWQIGCLLREGYAAMLRRTPWLYDAIFQAFFTPRTRWQPSTSPLVVLAARRLHKLIAAYRPCAVVSTFHLAGQAAGWLRQRGRLPVPSVVVITEPAAHVLWAHPGTDLFVCPYPWVADDVARATGKPTVTPGPLVGHEFTITTNDAAAGRRVLGICPDEQPVVISAGAWGAGDITAAVAALTNVPDVRLVVLCGRNERLRQRLRGHNGCLALGWRDDLPTLFAAAGVLVDNAGGTTCAEAFAARLPVVTYHPLPGHGRVGVRALADAGLVTDGQRELPAAVKALCTPGPARDRQCRRAAEVFRADPATVLTNWLADVGVPLRPSASDIHETVT